MNNHALNRDKKIVVVDADINSQNLLTAYFTEKKYDITIFSNAESALFESKNEKWDIIILDKDIPEMSHLQFIELLKKSKPQLPILFAVSAESIETVSQMLPSGLCDFIIKPIHLAQLHISIERVLRDAELKQNVGVEMFALDVQKTLPPLQEVVKKYIQFAVSRNGGAKDRTAKEIGIDRKTLYRKMKNFVQCA